ncbi:hypothetical protein HYT51_00095 [Candidatus Woesearchaeota archaeon]|nr:hypothetical protein [Candidatus Woesearchaeota archaeon]
MKRGASELIATVLILGFVIVLAVVLFAWQTGFFEDIKGKLDIRRISEERCLAVDVEIMDACDDTYSGQVNLILKNNGPIAISNGFHVILFDASSRSEVPSFPYPILEAYHTERFPVNRINPVIRVEIIPKIEVQNQVVSCLNNRESRFVEAC